MLRNAKVSGNFEQKVCDRKTPTRDILAIGYSEIEWRRMLRNVKVAAESRGSPFMLPSVELRPDLHGAESLTCQPANLRDAHNHVGASADAAFLPGLCLARSARIGTESALLFSVRPSVRN